MGGHMGTAPSGAQRDCNGFTDAENADILRAAGCEGRGFGWIARNLYRGALAPGDVEDQYDYLMVTYDWKYFGE
jgi:hypothetical protein